MTKKSKLLITFAIIGTALILIGLVIGSFVWYLIIAPKFERKKAIEYFSQDDNYIYVDAKITKVETNEYSYYFIYLDYDEYYHDLRFADYCDLIPPNADAAKSNGFNFESCDTVYRFCIGRKSFKDPDMLPKFPIVEISEIDGSKVYLDYSTGKNNLVSYLEAKN